LTIIIHRFSATDFLPEDSFDVFPNPTVGLIQISGEQPIDLIEVMDLQGRIILRKNNRTNILDITKFSNGTYLVKLNSGNRFLVTKIVKQ